MKLSQQIQWMLDDEFQQAVGQHTLFRLRELSDFLDGLIEKGGPHPKVVAMRKRVSNIITLIEVGEAFPKEKS